MFAKSTVAIALFASFVAAQTTANSTIDPNSVDLTTRTQWCSAEISTCGTLCSGNVGVNSCDPPTLNYTCTCAANNSAPGLQYYTETMPTFICERIFSNCITAGEMDAAAQAVCKKNEAQNCGQLSPDNFTAPAASTSSSSTAAPATTTSVAAAGTAAAASTSSTSTSKAAAATMMAMGREYGAGVVAAGVAAAFGFML